MESPIKEKTPSNERENKETAPDFLKIFNEKLESIEPVTGEDAKGLASWYEDPEIVEIRREVPAVFFNPNNLVNFAPPTDIYIENPRNINIRSNYVHDEVKDKLGQLINKSTMPNLIAGYLLEDGNGVRYLVLDETRAKGVKQRMEYDEEKSLAMLDVLNKYKISKVIEKYSKTVREGDTTRITGTSREVIGKSMLDKRREDIALINLARKHKMTNSQYLRLKILADSLFKAGKQVSLDEIAESIVKDPDNENISVKHLPLE
ncbi:hypothetical protein A2738_02925 [Candidatus Nomurabacteria bacterium RIFCSPHIGHO2_01_FULL_42_15]|uniref:Uncharacterized protein n=1 Tax=Candidatus Nomurabacteria bacterium RIFCSPHIGHO2_01_FULL_42_15 TaxID=1801742 RepID=A0A1F6VET5_9BACT|nr:MAG: hypothetical protein A2738_02925 [Candidatus Nomurabacteria bacterium RIFCSPHIGHO2_01_FULL_42_15]OGI92820.1 MAG: hypothetical protein A3A99_02990 [Candidatus Nomurabacteria bacterium RIFCSPLOWO2_01_FULL_41_18]